MSSSIVEIDDEEIMKELQLLQEENIDLGESKSISVATGSQEKTPRTLPIEGLISEKKAQEKTFPSVYQPFEAEQTQSNSVSTVQTKNQEAVHLEKKRRTDFVAS